MFFRLFAATFLLLLTTVAHAQSISVQVQQDAYRVADTQNGTLQVEVEVVNQGQQALQNGVLSMSLPNGTISHPKAASHDGKLVFAIGHLVEGDRYKITLEVPATEGVLSPGATVHGTVSGRMHTITSRALELQGNGFPIDFLKGTPEANPNDPVVQHQAAALGNNPENIFRFVRDEVMHQPYTGSLHGARGTIYESAGNRVDRASTLVALLRASGIPARYQTGTLSQPRKDALGFALLAQMQNLSVATNTMDELRNEPRRALSDMYPYDAYALGSTMAERIAAVRALSDDDLEAKTRITLENPLVQRFINDPHVWVEAYINGQWISMDPAFGEALVGVEIGSPLQELAGLPDAWKHKVAVRIYHEKYNAAFNSKRSIEAATIDVELTAAELVGKSLVATHKIDSHTTYGLFYVLERTLTPSIDIRDSETVGEFETIETTSFKELATSFVGPLANSFVTGVWLEIELIEPGQVAGQGEVMVQTLADRLGFEARNGLPVTVDGTDFIYTPTDRLDVTTLLIQAAHSPPRVIRAAQNSLSAITATAEQTARVTELLPYTDPGTAELLDQATEFTRAFTGGLALMHSAGMWDRTRSISQATRQVPYSTKPRVVAATGRVNADTITAQFGIDLMREHMDGVGQIGQPTSSTHTFRGAYGMAATQLEGAILSRVGGADVVSTDIIFNAADAQNIDIDILVGNYGIAMLENTELSAEAKIRIRRALQANLVVLAPTQAVTLGGKQRVAWIEASADGHLIGRLDTGAGGAALEYALLLKKVACEYVPCLDLEGTTIAQQIGMGTGYLWGLVASAVAFAVTCNGNGTPSGSDIFPPTSGSCSKFLSPAWDQAYHKALGKAGQAYAGKIEAPDGWDCTISAAVGFDVDLPEGVANLELVGKGACATIGGMVDAVGIVNGALQDPVMPNTPTGAVDPLRSDPKDRNFAFQTVTATAALSKTDITGTAPYRHLSVVGEGVTQWNSAEDQLVLALQINASGALELEGQAAGATAQWDGAHNPVVLNRAADYSVGGPTLFDAYSDTLDGVTILGSFGPYDGDGFDLALGASTFELDTAGTTGASLGRAGFMEVDGNVATRGSWGGDLTSLQIAGVHAAALDASTTFTSSSVAACVDLNGAGWTAGSGVDPSTAFSFANAAGTLVFDSAAGVDSVTANLADADIATLELSSDSASGFGPKSFDIALATSLSGDYTLIAESVPGMQVVWTDADSVEVTPMAGLPDGTYEVNVSVRNTAGICLSRVFTYAVAMPTTPQVAAKIVEDSRFTVDVRGVRFAARQLEVTHWGQDRGDYGIDIVVSDSRLVVKQAVNALNLRPGQTGRIGFWVEPAEGQPWPAPGTSYQLMVSIDGTAQETLVQNEVVGSLKGTDLTGPRTYTTAESGDVKTVTFFLESTGNVSALPLLEVSTSPNVAHTWTAPTAMAPGTSKSVDVVVNIPGFAEYPAVIDVQVGLVATAFEIERELDAREQFVKINVFPAGTAEIGELALNAMNDENYELAVDMNKVLGAASANAEGCKPATVAELIAALQTVRNGYANDAGAVALVAALDQQILALQTDACTAVLALGSVATNLETINGRANLIGTISTASPVINGVVTPVNLSVINGGATEAPAHVADLKARRGASMAVEIDRFDIPALAPGASHDVTSNYDTTGSLGTYVMELVVDVDNVVAERSETDNIRVTVLEVLPNDAPPLTNDAPVFGSIAISTASVGADYSYTPVITDPNGDMIFLEAPVRPPGIKLVGNELKGVPPQPGIFPVVLLAMDRFGAVTEQSFDLDVSPFPVVNATPKVTTTPTRRLVAGQAWTYDIEASDADGDSVTYFDDLAPTGLVLTSTVAGAQMTWTPGPGDVGIHWISVRIVDSRGAETRHRFSVNVSATALGADLQVYRSNTSGIIYGANRSGVLTIDVVNQGDTVAAATDLDVWEERDFVAGRGTSDVFAGTGAIPTLSPGESASVAVNVSGAYAFKNNILHIGVDASDFVTESDETNNIRHTAQVAAPANSTYVAFQDQESDLVLVSAETRSFRVFDPATDETIGEGTLQSMTPTYVPVTIDDGGNPVALLDTFVVEADGPVSVYLNYELFTPDFGGDFYHVATDGNRVGRDFVVFLPTLTVNNRLVVTALDAASVTLEDDAGVVLQTLNLSKGQPWEPLNISEGQAYRIRSSADLLVHSASVTGMSVVPPANAALAAMGEVAREFVFNTRARGANGGAAAILAYEDATYTIKDESGTTLVTNTILAGTHAFHNQLGEQLGLVLEASGDVALLAGDVSRSGLSTIDLLGEDITSFAGARGVDFVVHALKNDFGDSLVVAGPEGAAVQVDGVTSALLPFGTLALAESMMHLVQSSSPVFVRLFGGDDRYYDYGDALRPFASELPVMRASVDQVDINSDDCGLAVEASARVGNSGGATLPASVEVELVEISTGGEHVLATTSLGQALVPGQWVDLNLAGPSATSGGSERTWLVRLANLPRGMASAWSNGGSFVGKACSDAPPTFITTPPTAALVVGEELLYVAEAVDPEGLPVTYQLLVSPQGAAIGNTSGALTWIASANVSTLHVSIQAQDQAGNVAIQSFELNVGPATLPCLADADGDGFCTPRDCNDTDASIHPGALEILGDGLDNDCLPETADMVAANGVHLGIFTDSRYYDIRQPVLIMNRLTNLSPLVGVGAAEVDVEVICGAETPWTTTLPSPTLAAGSMLTMTAEYQPTSTGSCDVETVWRAGTSILARASTSFDVGTAYSGTLSAVLVGDTGTLSWTVERQGGPDAAEDVVVSIGSHSVATPFESSTRTFAPAETKNGDVSVDITTLDAGQHIAELKVNGVVIARAGLDVRAPCTLEAPRATEATDFAGSPIGLVQYQVNSPTPGGQPVGAEIRAEWTDDALVMQIKTRDVTQEPGDLLWLRLVGDETLEATDTDNNITAVGTLERFDDADGRRYIWTIPAANVNLATDTEYKLLAFLRDGESERPRGLWVYACAPSSTYDDPATYGTLELVETSDIPEVEPEPDPDPDTDMGPDMDTRPYEVSGGNDGCGCATPGTPTDSNPLLLLVGLLGGVFFLRRQKLRSSSRLWAAALIALGLAACSDDTTSQTPHTGVDSGADAGSDSTQTDSSADVDNDGTVQVDAGAPIGTTCEDSGDCASGICLVGVDYNVCTSRCEQYGCEAGWTCERYPGGAQVCVPSNICIDQDNDGYGAGRACLGLDCNDRIAASNPAATEICDGLDNDCDGEADEDLLNSCGLCGPEPEEVCNGLDDNCDGVIDDGVKNACGGCGQVPTEVCNGIDDNCDGNTDESCPGVLCQNGETQPCFPGDPGSRGVGMCADGIQTCSQNAWGACFGAVLPGTETCDDVDNDCDGNIDENLLNSCGTCGAIPREICNGVDDNCDGNIDEGVLNRCGTCGPCGETQLFPNESGFGDPAIAPAPDGGITLGQGSVSNYHLWVPNSSENTVSRWNTRTKKEEARYWVGENPSRTAIDLYGNAWVGNRGDGIATHFYANTADCIDRNNDGVIQTSRDLNGDGQISGGEVVNTSLDPLADECMHCQVRVGTPTDLIRGVAVDADNNVWLGTWNQRAVYKVDSQTCQVVATVPINQAVYGLVADSNGHVWTSGYSNQCTVKIDINTATEVGRFCAPNGTLYGLAVDADDNIWFGGYNSSIWKFDSTTEVFTNHVAPSGLSQTTGVMVDLTGKVFVAGYTSHSIGKYDPVADNWETFSVRGASTGLRDQTAPRGVTIDADNKLWSINLSSSGLLQMELDGTPLASLEIKNSTNPAQGVAPYSYSDNTGFQLLNYTTQRGAWRYLFDAGQLVDFASLTYNAYLPAGSSVEVRVRSGATSQDLQNATFSSFMSPSPVDLRALVPTQHRYLEMEFLLIASSPTDRPVLRDIQVFFENDDCRTSSCPVQQTCNALTGSCLVTPTSCTDDSACSSGQYCDTNNTCASGCRIPNDCNPGSFCNANTRVCEVRSAECFVDNECAVGTYCDATNFCEAGCRNSPDTCPIGFECNLGNRQCDAMPPECALDTECPAAEFCDPNGRCILGCRVGGTDCAVGEICDVTNICIPTPPTCDAANPQTETCNGLDDDCDGIIDNNVMLGATCDVGDAGATGFETCFDGLVWCEATPSGDPLVPVNLSGNLTNVKLPAGEWEVVANVTVVDRLRVDANARVFGQAASNLRITSFGDDIWATSAAFENLTVAGTGRYTFKDTTITGVFDGAQSFACNTLDALGTTFRNIAVDCNTTRSQFSRYLADDSRVRWLLTSNITEAYNNEFEGKLTLPRIQSGLRLYNATSHFVQDNAFINVATGIWVNVSQDATIQANVFENNDVGVSVHNGSFPTITDNDFVMLDIGHPGIAIVFEGLNSSGGAHVTLNRLLGEPSDTAFLLDPDVFQTANPSTISNNSMAGLNVADAWLIGGNGDSGDNQVVLLGNATRYLLSAHVDQVGGTMSIGPIAFAPTRITSRPHINARNNGVVTMTGTQLDNVLVEATGTGTLNLNGTTSEFSRNDFGDEYFVTGDGTFVISGATFRSTAVPPQPTRRRHTGIRLYYAGNAIISGSTFESLYVGVSTINTSSASLSSNTFLDCDTGIEGWDTSTIDPITNNSFTDADSTRVSTGISLRFDVGGRANITSMSFDIGPEDRPMLLNPNSLVDTAPSTVAGLTFTNNEDGLGLILAGDLNADATIGAIDGYTTFTVTDRNIEIYDGATLTFDPNTTINGTDQAGYLLRVRDGAVVANTATFKNLTLQTWDAGSAMLNDVTFESTDTYGRTLLIADGTVTCTDCDFLGNDQKQSGLDSIAGATVLIDGATFSSLYRAVYVRDTTDLIIDTATFTDASRAFEIYGSATLAVTDSDFVSLNDADANQGIVTMTNVGTGSLTFTNLDFNIGPDDTPVLLNTKTLLDTQTLSFTGTTFVRDEGLGWRFWDSFNSGGTLNFGLLDTTHTAWIMHQNYTFNGTATLVIPPGTIFKATARNWFDFREDTIVNINGATFDNVRISFPEQSSGSVQGSTFTSDRLDSNPHIRVAGAGTLTFNNNLFTATGSGVGSSDGFSLEGSSPTITNNSFENLRRAIWLQNGAAPTLLNNTFTNNVADSYP